MTLITVMLITISRSNDSNNNNIIIFVIIKTIIKVLPTPGLKIVVSILCVTMTCLYSALFNPSTL